MATVTDTIGTQIGRDFSTITLWEASLMLHSGDDVTGECYNDSVFEEIVTINDAAPNSIKLTAAEGEQHDGTAGTGVRVATSTLAVVIAVSRSDVEVSWLELYQSSGSRVAGAINSGSGPNVLIANCIAHDIERDNSSITGINVTGGSGVNVRGVNLVVYNITCSAGGGSSTGIRVGSGTNSAKIYNCTVYNTERINAAGDATGISANDNGNTEATNCVSVGTTSPGTAVDFDNTSGGTESYNASSDATATGTGSITSIVTADQFVSIVGGSEDLHLKAGSDCIDAGTDLGTTPSGVEIDIDGRDRDAEGDTWDIGAHEFVAVVTGQLSDHRRLSSCLRSHRTPHFPA